MSLSQGSGPEKVAVAVAGKDFTAAATATATHFARLNDIPCYLIP
jgi:hypothetical protein